LPSQRGLVVVVDDGAAGAFVYVMNHGTFERALLEVRGSAFAPRSARRALAAPRIKESGDTSPNVNKQLSGWRVTLISSSTTRWPYEATLYVSHCDTD
jgi:hypothetical protein